MINKLNSYLYDITGLIVFGIVVLLVVFSTSLGEAFSNIVPKSFQHMNTIFLSILIEAIPFVLIGVLIAGFIQIFITEDHIKRWIPKNKFMASTMSCVVGGLFPACECGIVPIVRRLVAKGVPIYAGVGFLLTGPLINPIVILSTYMAFGNDLRMAMLRMGVGFFVALVIALIISAFFKSNQLKSAMNKVEQPASNTKEPFMNRISGMLKHSVDEFFFMGKYLIIGAFVAAYLQTYVSASSLFLFGDGIVGSTVVMMGLAYFLSLCSEADAFIGASFRNLFPSTSILAFLVYGPMIDLKNTIMLLSVFRIGFVIVLFVLITVFVFAGVQLTVLI